MPRNARKNIDGRYFHVMVQGIGKEHIFPDDNFKGYYISCLQTAKEKYPAKVLAFCVMNNHAHVLLVVDDIAQLSSYLRIANSAYASYYNRMNNRVGYVFRDRFKSQTILSERQLVYCLAYIQNNPLKAGLVARAEDYGYSSYTNYMLGRGTVDFEEAQKYYDISIENITSIMQARTDAEWLEHDDRENALEDSGKVLEELEKKYGVKIGDEIKLNIAALMTKEMQTRCGTTIKTMAKILGVGRERLRIAVVDTPVP